MRSTLFLAVGILLALGIFFARDRVKRAFQIGAGLDAIVLVFRFLVFGIGDPDNMLDLAAVIGSFFLIWVIAWVGTQAVLRYRARSDRPPS